MDFETVKASLKKNMDEKATNVMKHLVSDFYDGSKKTDKVGDEETSEE